MYFIEEIKKILPHRYPFLLVDRVTYIEFKKFVKGYKNISYNEPIFQGHFPNINIYPGVLIIESLAQLASFMFLDINDSNKFLPLLVGVDKFKFKRQVVPGDRLDMQAEVLNIRGNWGLIKAEAKVENKLVAKGEIKFALIEKDKKE